MSSATYNLLVNTSEINDDMEGYLDHYLESEWNARMVSDFITTYSNDLVVSDGRAYYEYGAFGRAIDTAAQDTIRGLNAALKPQRLGVRDMTQHTLDTLEDVLHKRTVTAAMQDNLTVLQSLLNTRHYLNGLERMPFYSIMNGQLSSYDAFFRYASLAIYETVPSYENMAIVRVTIAY